jgi:phosphatidylserine decarboxylase
MILYTLVRLITMTMLGLLAALVGTFVAAIAGFLFGLWVLFALFCLWFFRDPDPEIPSAPGLFVAPGSGTVDVIDEATESQFMQGACRRVSIFLSVFDVHVQRAPVGGTVAYVQRTEGQFMNAMRLDSAAVNENVLFGFESADRPGEKVAVRLIAGVLARRIVPWARLGESVLRGERISLIQFGSRVDLYLPPETRVLVKLGTKVQAGKTVIAQRS